MNNLRLYGKRPFKIAVIHGGPGAPGEMAPVARRLATSGGILEPLQTAASIEGQVRELQAVLEERGDLPVTLVGWSWGAWLSYIMAARYPSFVSRLILIGSGAYEEKYAADIMQTRLSRLSKGEGAEALSVMESLNDTATGDKDAEITRLGELIFRADSYDPLPHDHEVIEVRYDIYRGVWEEAARLRSSGALLGFGKRIRCPVVAIHGDYDPHLAEGVKNPLSRVLKDFRFYLLENCGHYPWLEKAARDRFYEILIAELAGRHVPSGGSR